MTLSKDKFKKIKKEISMGNDINKRFVRLRTKIIRRSTIILGQDSDLVGSIDFWAAGSGSYL